MHQKLSYQLLLHLIIFMWGFTGILGKLIHLEAIYIVWYRVLIAFTALGIALFLMKKSLVLDSIKDLSYLTGVGIIVSLHWVTFYMSIQLSTASLGILCLSTTTLHVTWLEPLVMKRKFSWTEFTLGLIVIYGIYFVSSDFKSSEYLALIYGLTAALCAALFSVFNAKLSQTIASHQITFYELVTGFVFLTTLILLQGKFNGKILQLEWNDLLWLLFLGILCTSFAFLATIEVVKRLGAFTVSLSINLEPVYTIILAVLILKEHQLLSIHFYMGALMIVLVVVFNAILKSNQARKV